MSRVFSIDIEFSSDSEEESDSLASAALPAVCAPKFPMQHSIRRFPRTNKVFEIEDPDYRPTHVYNLIKQCNKKLLKKKTKYVFLNKSSQLYSCTPKSKKAGSVALDEEHSLVIQHHGLYFVIIRNQDRMPICTIHFQSPDEDDDFTRRTKVRFPKNKDPNCLLSITKMSEDSFENHFLLDSNKNLSLAIANTKKIVFSIRKVLKGRFEITDKLDLDPVIVFGVAIACAIGMHPKAIPEDYFSNLISKNHFTQFTRTMTTSHNTKYAGKMNNSYS